MSSILRALKKLEQDTSTGRTTANEIPVNIEPGRQHKTALLVFATIAVFVISGAGAWFFMTGPIRGQGQTVHAGVKPLIKKMPLETKKIKSAFHSYADERTQLPLKNIPAAAPKNVNPEQLPAPKTMLQNFRKRIIMPESDIKIAPDTMKSNPAAIKNLTPPRPGPEEIEDTAGLKLQAISWSPSPARRMAVINGRICHEGESVEGYIVKKIGPDAVFLKKGLKSGKLSFALRR